MKGKKDRMESKSIIREKSYAFSLSIIDLCKEIKGDNIQKNLTNQLFRSGTSIGANIEEAYAGQSKKDFISKMSLALKEARETNYWLRLIRDASIVPEKRLTDIIFESNSIMNILAQIVITAKKKLEQDTSN